MTYLGYSTTQVFYGQQSHFFMTRWQGSDGDHESGKCKEFLWRILCQHAYLFVDIRPIRLELVVMPRRAKRYPSQGGGVQDADRSGCYTAAGCNGVSVVTKRVSGNESTISCTSAGEVA